MNPKIKDALNKINSKKLSKYEKLVPKGYEISYGMSGMFIKKNKDDKHSGMIKNSEVNNESDFKKALERELKVIDTPDKKSKVKNLGKLDWDKHGDGF